jgi:hypothetical protein
MHIFPAVVHPHHGLFPQKWIFPLILFAVVNNFLCERKNKIFLAKCPKQQNEAFAIFGEANLDIHALLTRAFRTNTRPFFNVGNFLLPAFECLLGFPCVALFNVCHSIEQLVKERRASRSQTTKPLPEQGLCCLKGKPYFISSFIGEAYW